MKPNNVIQRVDLTSYAFALMPEVEPILRIASLLAPVVPTGVTNGRYNRFDSTQAFKNYAQMARRAIGGKANSIGFLSDTANFNCDPFGLRIPLDSHERKQAGEAIILLEQAKTRTLQVNCVTAYLYNVIEVIKASISAMSGKGNWGDPAVDPIAEIDQAIKQIYLASGIVPNLVAIDFGAWCVLKNHPKIIARMPGADVAAVTTDRLRPMLASPNVRIEIVEAAILTGGGLANSSATKQGILGGSVFVAFNSPAATQYDPSFCKTFAPNAKLFTEVYQYPDAPHQDWYENDWTCDVEVVSTALAKRIDVSGANT